LQENFVELAVSGLASMYPAFVEALSFASASRKSFFCPFEYGRTYFAGISLAS
jgi:hypothetical protein